MTANRIGGRSGIAPGDSGVSLDERVDELLNSTSRTPMHPDDNDRPLVDWIADRSGRIFGLRITPTTKGDLVDATALSIRQGRQLIIVGQNMHGLYTALTNDAFHALQELPQSLVHIDGFPIVYFAWLHGLRRTRMAHRTGVHDWLPDYVRAASANRWRIYCLGSGADVNARAMQKLARIAPGAALEGRNGFFDTTRDGAENRAVLDDIAAFDPHIVLVGMGMGRQEKWILDNRGALAERCIITVGACLEYMAGEMRISPRWFGPFGLEALWRLVTRPRRYAHRYLVEPWLLLALLVRSRRSHGGGR